MMINRLSGSREAKPGDDNRKGPQYLIGRRVPELSLRLRQAISRCPRIAPGRERRVSVMEPTLDFARTGAIQACVAKGGIPECCSKYTTKL